jgi:hypothetical protein
MAHNMKDIEAEIPKLEKPKIDYEKERMRETIKE